MTRIPNTSGKAFINKPHLQQTTPVKLPSVNDGTIFKPEMTKPIALEDVQAMVSNLCDTMTEKGFDFKTSQDNDKFFDSLSLFLEESFNYPTSRNS